MWQLWRWEETRWDEMRWGVRLVGLEMGSVRCIVVEGENMEVKTDSAHKWDEMRSSGLGWRETPRLADGEERAIKWKKKWEWEHERDRVCERETEREKKEREWRRESTGDWKVRHTPVAAASRPRWRQLCSRRWPRRRGAPSHYWAWLAHRQPSTHHREGRR